MLVPVNICIPRARGNVCLEQGWDLFGIAWDCTGLNGIFRGRTKGGTRKGVWWFGKERKWAIQGSGDKRHQLCVSRWLVGVLVWPCPAQCHLSCLDSHWNRTSASGTCTSRGWAGRVPELLQDPPCSSVLTNRLQSCQARDKSRMRPLLLSIFTWLLCDLCGQPTCIYVHVLDACALCACWEHVFSLAEGWIWGHGAAAASPLVGGCIQLMYFPLMSSSKVFKVLHDRLFLPSASNKLYGFSPFL